MIHVVTSANHHLYARELAQLRLKSGAGEVAADEVGLLSLDGDGAPEFGCLLRPTTPSSVIAMQAPHLFAAGPEAACGPGVWEITRLYAVPRLCAPEPEALARRLLLRLAILEEARERGAERLLQIVEPHRLSTLMRSGWRFTLLGLPGDVRGVPGVVVEVDCSAPAIGVFRERLARGPASRLYLTDKEGTWAAAPKEVETFLDAARQLEPEQIEALLVALRAAAEEDDEA